ncbi:unnamed protein product, partial [Pylaiella littoralis]
MGHKPIDWEVGTPVSARFMRLKLDRAPGLTPQVSGDRALLSKSSEAGALLLVLVVGTSDGVVRILRGPQRRYCGSFVSLADGTARSIFELLGYRSSQVLGYVNRTTAGLRSKLRQEWRLHPLEPGQLARRTLEFLQWGRRGDVDMFGSMAENNGDAVIVFRGGVTHAINNLYGQVFGWEWEGELYRLFRERSSFRTVVSRRDPMTLGVHGAEVIRECL